MKSIVSRLLIFSAIILAFFTVQMVRAAEKPKLPLKHGYYVPEEVNCPRPDLIKHGGYALEKYPEETVAFDGTSFYGNAKDSNNFPSHVENIKKNGNIYNVKGHTYTSVGSHNMGRFSALITIESDASFTISKAPDMTVADGHYRYCGNPDNI